MGNLDGGTFSESAFTSGSSCSSSLTNTAEIEQQIKYDQEKKFASPAYKEIRTRRNGLKANGVTMNGNGSKVI